MPLLQALSAQLTLQLVEPRQSIGMSQPPAGQVILQAIPIGQVMGAVQGEQPEPQAKVQTPFRQAPPPATQSAQATSASGGPQVEVVPASTGRAPPVPLPPIPVIPPIPTMLIPRLPAIPPLPVNPPVPVIPPVPVTPPDALPPDPDGSPDGSPEASDPSPPAPLTGAPPPPPSPGSSPPLPLPLPLPPVAERPPAPLSTGAPPLPDVVTTAESPDRSTRHPAPRSATRTDMNNAGNRGPVFNFLRSFERAPSRQDPVSRYKPPLSMTMATLTHWGTWLP